MKNGKRIFSLVLVVLMCLSMMPVGALASEDEPSEEIEISQETAEEVEILNDFATVEDPAEAEELAAVEEPAETEEPTEVEETPATEEPEPEEDGGPENGVSDPYGECGYNATWSFEDGVLTISGTGEIWEGSWWSYRDEITELVVEEGITILGKYTFEGLSNLAVVTLPDSVESYDYTVFLHTAWLNKQADENGFLVWDGMLVDYVGSDTELVIPSTVTGIVDRFMDGNSQVTSVIIPGTVKTIGRNAFADSSVTKAVLKEGVTTIAGGAFSYSALRELTLPNSLTSVGDYAFEHTPWKDSQTDEFVVIGGKLFTYNGDGGNVVIPENVTELGDGVFAAQKTITSITFPAGLKTIGYNAFSWSTIQTIALPEGLTTILSDAFGYCRSLTKVILPNSVTTLDSYAFLGCESLTSIALPTGLTSIEYYSFKDCTSLASVSIPGNVTTIRYGAFENTGLTSVTLPNGVSDIQYGAFANCDALTTVTIPASVTSIGCAAFNSENLTDVYVYSSNVALDNNSMDRSDWANYPGIAFGDPDGTTIHGYVGSTAQAYAEEYGYKFEALTEVVLGDVDGDGQVTLKDVTLLFQYVNQQITKDKVKVFAAADVDGDKDVTLKDVTKLFQYVNQQINSL
jgi:hypothetical protein